MVLSGCNLGFNLGSAIWHSGTLAAAKQAVLLGLRGIAFSAPAGIEQFDELKPWMHRALDALLPLDNLRLVSVNLPREPRGLIWTRVSVRQYDGVIVPTRIRSGATCIGSASRPSKAPRKAPIDGRWSSAGSR